MSFLASFFPLVSKGNWGETLAGILPYFFSRHGAKIAKEEQILSLESIRTQSQLWQKRYGTHYITFTFSAIALAAKLVQIDSEANKAEIEAFYSHFPMPGGSKEKGAELFYEAYMDKADTRLYAKKIVSFYPGHQALYTQLLQALIKLAFADGPMNSQEFTILRKIATIFEINNDNLMQMLRDYLIPKASDPYMLLGAKKRTQHSDIKKAYREAIKDCHPDTFGRYDLPPEVKNVMIEKFKRLTNAYEAICKFRKFEG